VMIVELMMIVTPKILVRENAINPPKMLVVNVNIYLP